jgi:hypothetical protein
VAAALQGLEDLGGGLPLGFAEAASGAQPGVHVEHGSAPELALVGGLEMPFFSPLWPTYDQRASNWPRLSR